MKRWSLRAFVSFLVAWIAGLCVADLSAHPISLTSSLVVVEEETIAVDLEMMVEDLVLYYEMDHDEDFLFSLEAIERQAVEHEDFLLRYFQLRDGDGRRLDGRVERIDFSEVEDIGEGIHFDDLMAYSITYTVEYPLEARPEFLTVSQRFGGDEPLVPAEMEVRVFQHGVRVGPVVALSHHSAHTFPLDWDLDAEEVGDDLEAVRRTMRERRGDDLGITSYSAVYSYLYITEAEARHELLIPLLTLDRWVSVEREDEDFITVEEQEEARGRIFEFLKKHNRVEIDGAEVAPDLARLDFFGPEFRDFAREVPPRDLSAYNTRVGVILEFPADEAPGRVKLEWDFFDELLPALRTRVYPYQKESQDALFQPFQTTFEWEKDEARDPVRILDLPPPEPSPRLRLPVLSLLGIGGALFLAASAFRNPSPRRRLLRTVSAGILVIGAVTLRDVGPGEIPHPFKAQPTLSEAERRDLFEGLHRNVYRAFEHRDEQRIYDALEQSVSGQLLEDLYLQIRAGLQVQEQGGPVSRVEEVEFLEGRQLERSGATAEYRGFEYEGVWTVTGTVEHWGHIHTRKNQYEAVFTIQALPAGWRITGFEPLQEQRLEMRTRLRR